MRNTCPIGPGNDELDALRHAVEDQQDGRMILVKYVPARENFDGTLIW